MRSKSVVVIGGGPAGMMAAGTAASRGHKVTLVDSNERLGRKLAITGNGRCNLTRNGDVDDLLKGVIRNRDFLRTAVFSLSSKNLMGFFLGLDLHTYADESGRVYPISGKAEDIVDALIRYLEKNKVQITRGSASAIIVEGGQVAGVVMKDREVKRCERVILATGGRSYPETGSTGDGYEMVRPMGHSIVDPNPCLVPLDLAGDIHLDLQGVSVSDVWIEISDRDGKWIAGRKGDAIFTHFGISGPAVLKVSGDIPFDCKGYTLSMDLRPDDPPDAVTGMLLDSFTGNPRKSVLNTLSMHFPRRIAGALIESCGIDPNKNSNQVSKAERRCIQNRIKRFDLIIEGMRPVEEAVVTAGGVDVSEIDHLTMGSNLVKGLYFAGEVMDVHGTTGGYNLQIAFSTGYLAGLNC
ncbi:MAG: NAD(P)/FAD-dependent oxidoreductase [Thermoplasmatota archaeon]